MTVGDERYRAAVAAIDAVNAEDPNTIVVRGEERPKELAHAELMTAWVQVLDPGASESLLLAARAHHLRRWAVPRSSYPEGKRGYLRWRRDLHQRHATEAGQLLASVGYDDASRQRVATIVAKEGLAHDAEVQTLEDALCLVFLETQFADLAARTDPDRMVEITRRTLAKMSERGRALALELAGGLRDDDQALLARALSEPLVLEEDAE